MSKKREDKQAGRKTGGEFQYLTVPRRNVLSAMGVTAIAGCTSLESGSEESEESQEPDMDEEGSETKSIITPAEIISDHSEYLLNTSYTFHIDYQGEEDTADKEQYLEYKYDNNQDIAKFDRETSYEDGVDLLSQFYRENDYIISISLEDRDPLTLTLRENDDTYEQMTGESVFRYYLSDAEFDDPYEEEANNGEDLTVYEITSHRLYDSLDGVLKIDADDGFIQSFRFEWLDSENVEHWIDYELFDIGQTDIDIEIVPQES